MEPSLRQVAYRIVSFTKATNTEAITISRRRIMELLRWKTRIAVLWIVLTVNFSAFLFVSLLEPGAIKELLETQANQGTRSPMLVLFFIPFIMAWLSMTLKDSTNRWINLVLSILFAVFFVGEFIRYAAAGRPATILVAVFFAFVVDILIVWYAWKWPKQEA
jgi:hypothetical protein